MSIAVVCADQLTKVHRNGAGIVRALDGVSLRVPAGQFVSIMGPSGSGKTTLLHCLAGIDTPTSGRCLLAGADVGALSARALAQHRREHAAIIFQHFNLLPLLTVRENIELPAMLARRRLSPHVLRDVLEACGLPDRAEHFPHQLSGGEQQRVAIARALVSATPVVFADEPTGNLDTTTADAVLTLLRSCVRDQGTTVLMVTHDPQAAARAGRAIVLRDGQLVADLEGPTTRTLYSVVHSDPRQVPA